MDGGLGPEPAAFRPDEPQGTYTAPAADAPDGAAGYQTFGYTGVLDGSAGLDLVYAGPGGAVGERCAPVIAVGVAADPYPPDDTLVPAEPPSSAEPTDEPTVPPTSMAPGPAGTPTPWMPFAVLALLGAVSMGAVVEARPARRR